MSILRSTALYALTLLMTNIAAGQYLDETTETNINKVDPLFERSVDNLEDFKAGLEQEKQGFIENIGSSNASSIAADQEQMMNERTKLESISVYELETKGREEFAKDSFNNEMFVNLNKPGMRAHLEDAIAKPL